MASRFTRLTTVTTLFVAKSMRQNQWRRTAVRSIHATTPTADSLDDDCKRSPDHLRKTFRTFEFKRHPCQEEGPLRPCNLKEDEPALYARVDMPGVSKRGLDLRLENNRDLHILGEEDEDEFWERQEAMKKSGFFSVYTWREHTKRKFSTSLAVDPAVFDTDRMKAVLKNGVLWIVVPKI